MYDSAGSELEIVLRLRIELGANVIAPKPKRDTFVIAKVGPRTCLKSKRILPAAGNLWNHVNSANQKVHPGLVLAPLIAPCNAATTGVEEILRRVSAKHFGTKCLHSVAFNGKPVAEKIAERCVYPVQI